MSINFHRHCVVCEVCGEVCQEDARFCVECARVYGASWDYAPESELSDEISRNGTIRGTYL